MPPLHWEYVHLRTVVFLSKAKTSKYHFCSSVCIAFFWHFKKSGVSWMCIRVCLMYLLASVLSCLLCSLTWAQTLQTLGLGAPWATGVAGGGESAHALSKWQNSCLCAALLWDTGLAASRFTPCHACGVSHCKRLCTVLLPQALL